jgi:hypothetical protein
VKLPLFPAPDARDPDDVAKALATATELWNLQQYADVLPHLLNAALLASARMPVDDPRVKELARAATEVSAFVSAPGSIPISIELSGRRLTPAAGVERVAPNAPASPTEAAGVSPRPAPRVRKGTLPEESRPAPDTIRVEPNVPPPPTIDLTGTVPQGYPPAPTTRRVDPKKKT